MLPGSAGYAEPRLWPPVYRKHPASSGTSLKTHTFLKTSIEATSFRIARNHNNLGTLSFPRQFHFHKITYLTTFF